MECDILDTFPERQESTEYEDDGNKKSKSPKHGANKTQGENKNIVLSSSAVNSL